MASRRFVLPVAALLLVTLPLVAAAQWRGFYGRGRRVLAENVPYDGQLTFARVRYQGYNSWAADYPTMERNLMPMLQELTSIRPRTDATNVFMLDDPELFKHPIAYLEEPGYWFPTPEEVAGLRLYLQKGGFLIADDFAFRDQWRVFEQAILTVLPEARIERLELTNPIFDTFFRIKSLEVPYPGRLGEQGVMGEFYGIYEDNDPTKRLQVMINHNIDIGDYVEWSAEDIYNRASTSEAYKFMVNYFVYGLTR
jgi:hypothetical protein